MMEPSTVSPLLHVIRRMTWLATAITVISCAVFFVQLRRWEHARHHRRPRIVAHHMFVHGGPICPRPSPQVTSAGAGSARFARLAVTNHLARLAVSPADVADPHAVWSALGLTQIDAHTFTIDRALARAVMAAPLAAMRGERSVPIVQAGTVTGVRLFHLTPASALTAIGLHDGDTLLAINDVSLGARDAGQLKYRWQTEALYRLTFVTRDGHHDFRNLVFR